MNTGYRPRGAAPTAVSISGVPSSGQPVIAVRRGDGVLSVSPDQFTSFVLQDGDTIEIPPELESMGLRTPDGQFHLRVRSDTAVRIPASFKLVAYDTYSLPEHLMVPKDVESFGQLGKASIRHYERVTRLRPDMTFLEIGSGIGRTALHLTSRIGPQGRYIGVDVNREAIHWAQANITPRFPSFTFHHVDAAHALQNPLGTGPLSRFNLPVGDASVDFVVLNSVLTHLFEDDATHYLKEIARVLKPEGLCYITFFLYRDDIVEMSRRNNPGYLHFYHMHTEGCYFDNPDYPLGAVAYSDWKFRSLIDATGLALERPYIKGYWSGRYVVNSLGEGEDAAVLRRLAAHVPNGSRAIDRVDLDDPVVRLNMEIAALRDENAELSDQLNRQSTVARIAGSTNSRFLPPQLSPEHAALVAKFNDFLYNIQDGEGRRTYMASWMGHEMFKWPSDLWAYQELIARNRPSVIVETGTYLGGSALFFASICDLLGAGEVVSVDIETAWIGLRPKHPRITYLNGSSTAPDIFERIVELVDDRRALVILDSDHHCGHVLDELRLYHHLIRPGDYLVVEDTCINGHPVFPDYGPGPWEAVEAFLAENNSFAPDLTYEPTFVTQNPRGFLKRLH